ncbi:MAG: type IV pili twitching motility protein PilT, partial [Planctomycetes bacterium]|nr:type IV pili twitching motility protein PilT [Planctomycetota bacterium]
MAQIDRYLRLVREAKGSDLHIGSFEVPKVRIHGKLTPLKEPPLPRERMAEMIAEVLNERQKKIYYTRNDLDMAYELPGIARFRVNVFLTRKGPAAVFRLIPEEVTPLEELGIPSVVLRYAQLKSGLVLVTGPTG